MVRAESWLPATNTFVIFACCDFAARLRVHADSNGKDPLKSSSPPLTSVLIR